MRLRRVPAAAAHDDVEAIRGGHDGPGPRRGHAQGQVGPVVHGEHGLAGEPVEQALAHHLTRAAPALLGRLEDESDAALELSLIHI